MVVKIFCDYCNEEIVEIPKHIYREQKYFCSKECRIKELGRFRNNNRKFNEYRIEDNKIFVKLKNGKEFIMDLEFEYLLSKYIFYINKGNYIFFHDESRKFCQLHRFLTNCPKNKIVDHIDRNPLNNCLSNLRICTQSDNLRNRKHSSGNKSGFIGVSLLDSGKYRARIKVNGKYIWLGTFTDVNDAINARIDAEYKYWGESYNEKYVNVIAL